MLAFITRRFLLLIVVLFGVSVLLFGILMTFSPERRAATYVSSPQQAKDIPKIIKEFFGCVNSGSKEVSIAKMESPAGWSEPGQTPEFDEYTVVLKGVLHAETQEKVFEVNEGEAICIRKGEWVRYSTPGGAEYIAVCLPAFTLETVNRDEE